MTDDAPFNHPLRLADLAARKPTRFTLEPDAAACIHIAKALGIDVVRKTRFKGELRPLAKRDWRLEARLEATVIQPCIATLAPVTTRIQEDVTRNYLADMPEPAAEETEMPDDDTAEPLPAIVDLGVVMTEALALALPLYPRADSAADAGTLAAPPGTAPLTDEALRPFAGLADLMKKQNGNDT